MVDVGRNQALAGSLDRGMNGLNGLLGGGKIRSDDDVNVLDLPHASGSCKPRAGLEPASPRLELGSLPLT